MTPASACTTVAETTFLLLRVLEEAEEIEKRKIPESTARPRTEIKGPFPELAIAAI